ncbi:MAG: hypothetical protein EXR62_16770 [Chloroflexi bacterium]|nr:hypothetical protein [Chloroflexota bacterium]
MSESYKGINKGEKGRQMQLNLAAFKQGEERPAVVVTAVDRNGKTLRAAQVDGQGNFDLPEDVLKVSHRILIGPSTENPEEVDPDSLLRYRAPEFAQLAREGVVSIPRGVWEKWILQIRCVTGTVKKCRRGPWWFNDLVKLATTPVFETQQVIAPPKLSLRAEALSRVGPAQSISELVFLPFRCQVICNGTVEVYRRTCCCEPWVIFDPRIPDLIRDLEGILRAIPEIPPIPNPPDPPDFVEALFFKEGSLDEMALNARRDLTAIRSLPTAEVAAYINARPYLLCRRYSCGLPQKVGQGSIHPDGRFTICWIDGRRILGRNCHDEYAYVVKQRIGKFAFTVYNGVAANIWFNQNTDASLVSYSPFAYACRDNGEPGTGAYVYLDIIGDTESWNLKTPNATGWDRVAAPAYNDGLVFPTAIPAAAVGANLNRNWGGTLKLNYKFSEDMRIAPVSAKYYRISITEADSTGHPTGDRYYLSDGLSWEKSVPTGTGVDIVPVVLGPFSQGGQDNLFIIPYDAEGDWNAGQYHGYLNTNDTRWRNPEARHLVTVEVFDAAGKRLRPTAAPPTGLLEAEGPAPFTFRRRFQDLGPMAEVPFAALTHMFWWDNRPVEALIVDLRKDGGVFNEECLFFIGTAASTFGIGFRAYHPNEMFQLSHSIHWKRGLGSAAGSIGYLEPGNSSNIGVPPNPPGTSPTNTFAQMLRTDLDPTRKKCAFTVFLDINAKTTDGDDFGNPGTEDTAAFAIEIN